MVHQKANPQLKLFSLSSNPEIAEKIAELPDCHLVKYLHVNFLTVKS